MAKKQAVEKRRATQSGTRYAGPDAPRDASRKLDRRREGRRASRWRTSTGTCWAPTTIRSADDRCSSRCLPIAVARSKRRRSSATPLQAHHRQLANMLDRTGMFLDPIIAVTTTRKRFLDIQTASSVDGDAAPQSARDHRAGVVPKREIAWRILALDAEKTHATCAKRRLR